MEHTSVDTRDFAAASQAADFLCGTPIEYTVERHVEFDYGFVEVGRFQWTVPLQDVVIPHNGMFGLNMALSPRSSLCRIEKLNRASNGQLEPVGRVLLTTPGCSMRLSVPSGKVRTVQCTIDPQKLEAMIGHTIDERESFLALQNGPDGPTIEFLLNRIYDELREDKFAAELAIDGYANALCVELARSLKAGEEQPHGPRKGGLAPWRIRLLDERIFNDGPAPRLPELAELTGLTVRQLSRAFKAETGMTLGTYIDEAVVERACQMLTRTDHTVAEIASRLGFATAASFTYSFRRARGLPPGEYRRRGNI